MATQNDNEEAFIDKLLMHDQATFAPFIFFYVICTRLRFDWPAFNLAHLDVIASDLNIDTASISIRPDAVWISSGEIGELAAGVFGDHPRQWRRWKNRLLEIRENPPREELEIILEKIRQFSFIKNAWWSDGLMNG